MKWNVIQDKNSVGLVFFGEDGQETKIEFISPCDAEVFSLAVQIVAKRAAEWERKEAETRRMIRGQMAAVEKYKAIKN